MLDQNDMTVYEMMEHTNKIFAGLDQTATDSVSSYPAVLIESFLLTGIVTLKLLSACLEQSAMQIALQN
jgi:hypothetical protein